MVVLSFQRKSVSKNQVWEHLGLQQVFEISKTQSGGYLLICKADVSSLFKDVIVLSLPELSQRLDSPPCFLLIIAEI